eukprot:9464-Pelagococcus_subviridis.AAC.1
MPCATKSRRGLWFVYRVDSLSPDDQEQDRQTNPRPYVYTYCTLNVSTRRSIDHTSTGPGAFPNRNLRASASTVSVPWLNMNASPAKTTCASRGTPSHGEERRRGGVDRRQLELKGVEGGD